MKRILTAIATMSAAALLLLPIANANEAVCKPQKVKKVSRLCVFLVDQSEAPVQNANLIVFDGGKEVVEGVTDGDGRYSFDGLKKGSYQVETRAAGFSEDGFSIAVTDPSKKCKQVVRVMLHLGWLPCRGVVDLVKP